MTVFSHKISTRSRLTAVLLLMLLLFGLLAGLAVPLEADGVQSPRLLLSVVAPQCRKEAAAEPFTLGTAVPNCWLVQRWGEG